MVIAYMRVSTERQDLENQKREIIRYAIRKGINVDSWVAETISGTISHKYRKLENVISLLEGGDTLIITEISRLSRTLLEILTIMEDCIRRGISVYSVKDGYSFDSSINSTVLMFAFGLVSEIERKLISARTREALIGKRCEGKLLGRPKGSHSAREKLIKNKDQIFLLLQDRTKISHICRRYGVSRTTFERFREEFLC